MFTVFLSFVVYFLLRRAWPATPAQVARAKSVGTARSPSGRLSAFPPKARSASAPYRGICGNGLHG
jgi:hypothetical protein